MSGARTIGAASLTLALALLAAPLAQGHDLRGITLVQPSPSAIDSSSLYVAIGEGHFAEEGLQADSELVNGSSAALQAAAHTNDFVPACNEGI